jgi:hypothetical protein
MQSWCVQWRDTTLLSIHIQNIMYSLLGSSIRWSNGKIWSI